MIEKVKKRNRRKEKFSRHKLLSSIHHAMHFAGIRSRKLEEKIAEDVIKRLSAGKRKTADTEDIRKAVCASLNKNRMHKVCDFYSLVWLHAKPTRIRSVIKRDGRKEKFSAMKLFKSVQKSCKHAGAKDGKLLQKIMQDVLKILAKRYKGKDVPVEAIKETAEYVMVKHKLPKVAKRYILYRYM